MIEPCVIEALALIVLLWQFIIRLLLGCVNVKRMLESEESEVYWCPSEKVLDVSTEWFELIVERSVVTWVLYNDQEYKFDDTVVFREIDNFGTPTGKIAITKLYWVFQNMPGIEPGYCVLQFYCFGNNK